MKLEYKPEIRYDRLTGDEYYILCRVTDTGYKEEIEHAELDDLVAHYGISKVAVVLDV